MRGRSFSVVPGLFSLWFLLAAPLVESPAADRGADIAAWENFLRYHPRDARAERTFKAIVQAASAPEHYERNLEYADLVDIEKAMYDDRTGELILIGPRIRDSDYGYLPPLLVVDDFALALRVLDSIGERNLGVSIGTYNRGAAPGEADEDARLNRQPVEYIPELTAGTHMGFVFFEIDRWLKNIGNGVDNHTLEPLTVRIDGYQTQQERAYPYFAEQAARLAREGKTGRVPYGLNWFLPERPKVACEGYSMKFIEYHMTVQYKAEEPDPSIAEFSKHMTENFSAYCKEFPVFQELVRLHKLVQVAKWYRASGFPDEEIVDYTPVGIPTPKYTRSMKMRVGRFRVRGGYFETSLVGGIDFSPPNVYVPANAVPAHLLQPSATTSTEPLLVHATSGPSRYGSFAVGAAPIPAFVAPIVAARPSPDTYAWTVRVGDRDLKAIAVPLKQDPDARAEAGPPAVSVNVKSRAHGYSSQTTDALAKALEAHKDAASADEFLHLMESRAAEFPELKLTTGEGSSQWCKLTLNGSRTGMDAVRFTSPLDCPAEMYWAVARGADPTTSCGCVLPLHRYSHEVSSHDVYDLEAQGIQLPQRNRVTFHHTRVGKIVPNQEYILYFHFENNEPTEIQLAVALVPGRSADSPSSAEDVARVLGLPVPLHARSIGPEAPGNSIPLAPAAPVASEDEDDAAPMPVAPLP